MPAKSPTPVPAQGAATEWFANIGNLNTRRAYSNDLQEFMMFIGIATLAELRPVSRADVLAWRKDLERRELAGATVRRKLAALSSLFEYLSEANAVTHNPVNGVRRPSVESYEGKTPALGDAQTRHLLKLPAGEGIQQLHDRALLSVLFHHGLRREEVCSPAVSSIHQRRDVPLLRVYGKGARCETFPYILVAMNCCWIILKPPSTRMTRIAPSSGRSATTDPAPSNGRLPPTAFTESCVATRKSSGYPAVLTWHTLPLRPTRSIVEPTSRKCRSGSTIPTSRRHGYMSDARTGRRIRRLSRRATEGPACPARPLAGFRGFAWWSELSH
jgi:hypothetical protein